jgi:hypothetical protein
MENLKHKNIKRQHRMLLKISLFCSFHRTQRTTEYKDKNIVLCDFGKEHPYSQISPTDIKDKGRRRLLFVLKLCQKSYIRGQVINK